MLTLIVTSLARAVLCDDIFAATNQNVIQMTNLVLIVITFYLERIGSDAEPNGV